MAPASPTTAAMQATVVVSAPVTPWNGVSDPSA